MARTDASEKAKAAAAKALKETKPPPPPLTPADVFARSLSLLEKFAETRDSILLSRVLRFTRHIRLHLPIASLRAVIESHVGVERRAGVLAALAEAVAASSSSSSDSPMLDVDAGAAAAVTVTTPPIDAAAAGSGSGGVVENSTSTTSTAVALKMPRVGGPAALEIEAYLTYIVLAKVASVRAWSTLSVASETFIAFIAPHNKRSLDWFQVRREGKS